MTDKPSISAQNLLNQIAIVEANLDRLEQVLNKAEKGIMGLTLDSSKTLAWTKAKHEYDVQFCRLGQLNRQLNKLRKCVGYEINNGKRKAIYKYL